MPGTQTKSARQWALRALGRRMHTRHEITTALSRRGFAEDVVGRVVADLVELGCIDDLHFAQVWVSSRTAHQHHGRLRLLSDLKRKGIPEEVAQSVLRDAFSDGEEVALARKAAEKKLRTLRAVGMKGRAALYRHLRSRGFTTHVIRLALAETSFEEEPT